VSVATKEQIELSPLMQNDPFFDKTFLADIKAVWENSAKEGEKFQEKVAELLEENAEEEIPYYLNYFFDQWREEDIDVDYLLRM
jgi:hypothetical protein